MGEDVTDDAAVPLTGRAVASALAAFWGAFVFLNTARAAMLGYADPLGALLRRILLASVGIALAWAIYRLLARHQGASLRRGIILTCATSLPAALVFSTTNFIVFDMLAPHPGEGCGGGRSCTMHDLVVSVSDQLINWTFVFVAWGTLYLSLASAARTRAADRRASEHREAARLAQIRALRYQVNPHFLFNVLNSLTALVSRRETAEAEALIGEIGAFLRFGLATDPIADTELRDEIEMQRRYLELERRRFPARLTFTIDAAPGTEAARVPPLILQPLIENAVKHGVSRTTAPVTIRVTSRMAPGPSVEIVVRDDALPVDPAECPAAPTDGLGVGLSNVCDRLAARFGAAASLEAGPVAGGGFRAVVTLPLLAA